MNCNHITILASSACFVALIATAAAGTLGGPLELADEGSFFIGGQAVRSEHPGTPGTGGAGPGTIMTHQMYVQFRIPKTVSAPPIVMVHGSGHTGVTFETTPDGREGWATYFARKGFPVYVVDHAGRGRSSFDPTPINRARAQGDAKSVPDIPLTTRERAWQSFRLGAKYPDFYPGSQFPTEALDQYFSQLVPNTEATLAGGGANTVKDLAALLDKIGPAIVLVHSQSGAYGLELVRQRADKMRAFVEIEGSCGPLKPDEVTKTFAKVPLLAVFGDNSVGAEGPNGDERRNGCIATTKAVQAAGGSARFMLLPEQGLRGNTHMMMLDKNNLQIADLVIGWLGQATAKK